MKLDLKALSHVQAMFPKLSAAKVKGGILTGPRIRQKLSSKELKDKMSALKKDAWQSICNVEHGFLGRNNAENYEDSIETLLQTYCKLGSRMSFKIHYWVNFDGCERRAWFSPKHPGNGEEVSRKM